VHHLDTLRYVSKVSSSAPGALSDGWPYKPERHRAPEKPASPTQRAKAEEGCARSAHSLLHHKTTTHYATFHYYTARPTWASLLHTDCAYGGGSVVFLPLPLLLVHDDDGDDDDGLSRRQTFRFPLHNFAFLSNYSVKFAYESREFLTHFCQKTFSRELNELYTV